MPAKTSATILLALILTVVSGPAAHAAQNIIIPGGSMGGSMYTTATLIANIVNKNVPELSVSARASGTKENIYQLRGGEVAFAMASGFDYFVTLGEQPGESKDINVAMVMYRQYIPTLVRGDSAVKTLADLRGKRVNIMDRRTGGYTASLHVLEAAGLTEKDIIPIHMSSAEGATTLTEGRIDANINLTALPAPSMSIMTNSSKGAKLVPMTDAELAAMTGKYPFYTIKETSPDLLPDLGVTGPVPLPTYNAELLVGADVPEELVYTVVKAVMEHTGDLAAGMKSLNEVSPGNTIREASMPLHPGAIRYFKEIGAL